MSANTKSDVDTANHGLGRIDTPTSPNSPHRFLLPLVLVAGLIGFGLKDYNLKNRWEDWRGSAKYSCPKFSDGFKDQLGRNAKLRSLNDWPDLKRRGTMRCYVEEDRTGYSGLVIVETRALKSYLDRLVTPANAKPVDLGVSGAGSVFTGLFDPKVQTTRLPSRVSSLIWRCQDRRMAISLNDYTKNGKRTDIVALARRSAKLLDCDIPGEVFGPLPRALTTSDDLAIDTTEERNSCPGLTREMARSLTGDQKLEELKLDFWSLEKYPQSGKDYECTITDKSQYGQNLAVLTLKLNEVPAPVSGDYVSSLQSRAQNEFSLTLPGRGFTFADSASEDSVLWVCDKGAAEITVPHQAKGSSMSNALRVLPSLAQRLGCAA